VERQEADIAGMIQTRFCYYSVLHLLHSLVFGPSDWTAYVGKHLLIGCLMGNCSIVLFSNVNLSDVRHCHRL